MTDDERYGIAVIALENADARRAAEQILREFPHASRDAVLSVLSDHEPFLRSQDLGTFDALRKELALRRPRRVISVGRDNADD